MMKCLFFLYLLCGAMIHLVFINTDKLQNQQELDKIEELWMYLRSLVKVSVSLNYRHFLAFAQKYLGMHRL